MTDNIAMDITEAQQSEPIGKYVTAMPSYWSDEEIVQAMLKVFENYAIPLHGSYKELHTGSSENVVIELVVVRTNKTRDEYVAEQATAAVDTQ